ncbi:glyoxalase/bleomycin resistance protein/dioxygenase (plasmid) [Azospirillum sp. B510]|uniref:VOC family protein n=1 Tax=Azospirillum sp. (strain B510) TaxID=137722 RepID=UPI0001C4C942|nr:VOC family protein [Azospirillum sp. B510]BAI74679.1 glyoxalase/bleomycin resistance protein/dioxygenase [Azospirillum sp. B510]
MTDTALTLNGVLETALYVDDLARARAFYEDIMGLRAMSLSERLAAYPVGPKSVLLLFQKGLTDQPLDTPGGTIPPHGGSGRLHYAFAIPAEQMDGWLDRLAGHGVAIESTVSWPRGARSLYFRDPDGNMVELVTPGLWANY